MRDITHGRKLLILCFQVRLFFVTLGCTIASFALGIFVLPSVIILYTLYTIAYLCLKLKYGDDIDRANGLDIMYSLEDPKSAPYLNGVATIEGNITIDDFKRNAMRFLTPQALEAGGYAYKRAWQKMEMHLGYKFFVVDENFDMDNHIIVATNDTLFDGLELEEYYKKIINEKGEDAYGEFIKDEGQLISQRLMAVYGDKRVDPDRPQWEAVYYKHPGVDRVSGLFHGHHCISDGINILRYFFEHFGDKKVNYTLPYTFYQDFWLKRWAVNFLAFCMLPFGIWRLTYDTGINPLHGPKLSGKKIYVKSKYYPTAKMKEVKNKCDCSMITLLFNALSYALRLNYQRKGVKVRKTMALVPVPLQNFNEPPRFQNNHGLTGILMRTAALDPENDTALSRLEETKKLMYVSVRDPSFLPIQWIIMNIGPLLPQSVSRALFKLRGFTTSLTNIAGPEDEYFTICNGKGVGKEAIFWTPDRDPLGMGIAIGGYMGQCSAGLMVDKALMKNYRETYQFLEDFFAEFDNLRKELNLDDYKS